jgi:hypothetical protein
MRTPSPDTERRRLSDEALLDRLGLNGSASDTEVEAAYQEVAGFLEHAPGSLRTWAAHRLAEVDEAYAILRGPDRPDAPEVSDAADLLDETATVAPPPQRRTKPVVRPRPSAQPATNGHRSRSTMLGDALGGDDWYEAPVAPGPNPSRTGRRAQVARGGAHSQPQPTAGPRFRMQLPRTIVAGVAIVALVAVLGIGYNLGGGGSLPGLTGTPDPGPTGPAVDTAQVSAYMTRLAANAEDVEALQGLANVYFAAGDYATAGLWLEKLLAVDPDNVTALLGSGAVAYNVGDLEAAESAWTHAAELAPDNVEVHYDLGFLYLAQEPPDLEMVRAEWQTVIDLEPDGAFAQTVAGHLDSIAPAASGSPAPSAAAEPSPAATSEASEGPASSASTGG